MQLIDELRQLKPEQLCPILDQLLLFLRQCKMTLAQVEKATGLKSLSKLRYASNLSRKFGTQNVFLAIENILQHYSIKLLIDAQQKTGYRLEALHLLQNENTLTTYAYYYYSLNEQCCKCAQLILNADGKTLQITFYKHGQLLFKYPPATLLQKGNHAFMQIIHPDSQHVSLTVWYCGNYPFAQLSLLTGIYNGIRQRDGVVVCGRVLLEKIDPNTDFNAFCREPIPKHIQQWLHEQYCEIPNKLFFDLDELAR